MAKTTTDLDRLHVRPRGAVIHNPDFRNPKSPGKAVVRPQRSRSSRSRKSTAKSSATARTTKAKKTKAARATTPAPARAKKAARKPPKRSSNAPGKSTKRTSKSSRKPAAGQSGKTPASATRAAPSILPRLGVAGMSAIEPVVLGGLVGGEPMLLIGPHGTGKSYMLCRISRALGLEWRHYNASLLNFDDLVGYPMPDERGNLRYVETPSSIWGAGTAFIDEISRCRPDLQNKLFPIIHERRVQGILLEKLVYRWSAMNPPDTDGTGGAADDEDDTLAYVGSEPLDPALADRFAFVVEMPSWETFSEADRNRVITAVDGPVDEAAAADLRSIVEKGRSLLPGLREELGEGLTTYVRIVAALLARASIELSPRRCGMLLRNILAVHAGSLAAGADADLSTSAHTALRCSLPQLAWGETLQQTPVLSAHREAWRACRLDTDDPRRSLVLENDPLRRLLLASSTDSLGAEEYSSVVADVLAAAPPGARHAVAASVLESQSAGRLVAAVAEQCAKLHAEVRVPQDFSTVVRGGSIEHNCWKRIESRIARLDTNHPDSLLAANLVVAHFRRGEITTGEEADALLDRWEETRFSLGDMR